MMRWKALSSLATAIKFLKLSFALSFLTGSFSVHAHDECHKHMQRLVPVTVVGSGRNEEDLASRREMFQRVYSKAEELMSLVPQLKLPPSVVHYMEPVQMAALLATGAHPAPHPYDGARVLSSAKQAAFVYEFIWGGAPTHHQYYRSINDLHEDARVAAHTVGHLLFAELSRYSKIRKGDPIRASLRLADAMEKASLLDNGKYKDEVQRFYQLLLTLVEGQDLRRGSYDAPETFEEKTIDRSHDWQENIVAGRVRVEPKLIERRHPQFETASILQAFVANLPEEYREEFRTIAREFEATKKVFPFVMQTKFMNEGFSVFMEWLILRYAYPSPSDRVEFSRVSGSSWSRKLSDPYWLGSEAWMRLYHRFMERPEMRTLQAQIDKEQDSDKKTALAFERDKHFLPYAAQLIQVENDYTFLLMALDDRWVMENKYFLYRKATEKESPDPWQEYQICVTVKPERVIQYIAQKLRNVDYQIPDIRLYDLNDGGSGRILLRHHVGQLMPLERQSLAKTLYVKAQLMRRPVSLDTVASLAWLSPLVASQIFLSQIPPDADIYDVVTTPWGGRMKGLSPQKLAQFHHLYFATWPMRVTVDPSGKVSVEFLEEDIVEGDAEDEPRSFRKRPEWLDLLNLETRFENAIKGYQLSLSVSYPRDAQRQSHTDILLQGISRLELPASKHVKAMKVNAPTAAKAVLEFEFEKGRRLPQIMELWRAGDWRGKFLRNGRGLQLALFPEVPNFRIDGRVKKLRAQLLSATPVDQVGKGSRVKGDDEIEKYRDEDLLIAQAHRQPGDLWPVDPSSDEGEGEGDEGDGDGEGDGEGEGDEGADADGDDEGAGGHGSGNDPRFIRVPIEELATYLIQELKLRNLRRTVKGDLKEEDDIRMGAVHRDSGDSIPEETAAKIYQKGMAILTKEGKDPTGYSFAEVYRIGLRHHTSDDIVVTGRDIIERPKHKAVILFARDASGSMGLGKIRKIDEFVQLTEAILRKTYSQVEIVYIIASDTARRVSRKDFFSLHFAGGTQMKEAVKLQEEIMETDYPHFEWNRFPFLFSDGEDFEPEAALQAVDRIIDKIEMYGYAHVTDYGAFQSAIPLSDQFLSKRNEFREKYGFAILDEDERSKFRALQEFFGDEADRPNYDAMQH